METSNGSDEAEAEPVAGAAATSLQPVKTPEDMLTFIDRNSRPIVGDRDDRTAITPGDLHRHLSGFTAVLDGVVYEIGLRIEQEVFSTCDEPLLIPDSIEFPAFDFRRGIE